MKLILFILTVVYCVSSVQAKPDDLARSIAERLLEDEEIWSQGDERLSDDDRAFFMRRADEAATAVAEGARTLSGDEQRRYIENALDGPDGVRSRLRAEIRECALTGTRPFGVIDAPPSSGGRLAVETPDPQTLIIGLVALAAIVPLVMVFFARRGRARS